MGKLEDVGALYEKRPYPAVSWLAGLRRDDLPLLNYQAGFSSCYGSLGEDAPRPRILVAGCGTVEAVAVALANPGAEILAVDLSRRSLEKLRWQARLKGVSGSIRTVRADIERLQEGEFDYVIATGVIHHLEDPLRGLRALVERSRPQAVFRLMLYSRWGRDLLYGARELADLLGVGDPKSFRALMASLPADHPYRLYFHLYSDARNDGGLEDGYLHPCDQPFTALSARGLLEQAGLRAARFLHRPEGQPRAAETLADFSPGQGSWERLAVLELLAQLEENFCFFAGRTTGKERAPGKALSWNPALPRKGRFHSRLLGEALAFDRSGEPDSSEKEKLMDALFLLPGGPG